MEHVTYPNESADYRAARNALLDAEIELRRQIERVAAMRRALPPGGAIPIDYAFERLGANLMPETVKLSALFGEHPSILLYSFMYGPERDQPCSGCTHMLDAIDGSARHANPRFPIYVVTRSPIARLAAWMQQRGWKHVIPLSDLGSYTADYHGNTAGLPQPMREARGYETGQDWDEPMFNVFRRDGDTVRHFWGSELTYAPEDPGQHHRAGDLVDPLWGLLDMSPEGRGDYFPKLNYD
jgi:predicted dithiol-disulfide oxidoreductase (DUF899 family)